VYAGPMEGSLQELKSTKRQRCAAAKTVHGRETRAIRAASDVKLREIKQTLKNAGLI
jgi:hypothetical protein